MYYHTNIEEIFIIAQVTITLLDNLEKSVTFENLHTIHSTYTLTHGIRYVMATWCGGDENVGWGCGGKFLYDVLVWRSVIGCG